MLLGPGDLLYLPRGYVHTTTTSAASSAHVTIGIDVYTWVDLAGEVMQAALASPRLRSSLPPEFANGESRGPVLGQLTEVLAALPEAASPEALLDGFVTRIKSVRRAARGQFRSNVIVVKADTTLEAPAPQSYRIVGGATRIALEYGQHRLLLPSQVLPVLEAMRAQRRFKAGELPAALDGDSQLALIRELVDRGFLVIRH